MAVSAVIALSTLSIYLFNLPVGIGQERINQDHDSLNEWITAASRARLAFCIAPAPLTAILNLVPILLPFFAPLHGQPADHAVFAG